MLNLKQIQLPNNILLIEEHPVVVDETVGGVHRDPVDIAREKSMRVFRTGKVISEGIIDTTILTSFSTKGKSLIISTLVGKTVMYMAPSVDIVDVPVEQTKRLVSINASYLFSLIGEE